jgi:hypothetical protein
MNIANRTMEEVESPPQRTKNHGGVETWMPVKSTGGGQYMSEQ